MQCKSELTILVYLSGATLFCIINEKDRINAKSPKKTINEYSLLSLINEDMVQNIWKIINKDSRLLNSQE